uniref:Uncharacterized protein n=1 Tax=Bicosoecida sp. CB-2014 TaxID=1486930 RepID=A0A7S1CG24_9STRA|mmetsp:Transcript_25302/g.88293  ORF Transcript_25302/g.88293 Transcript_25302/m.88293 type:complete len:612 (+) Transcript_25302:379-2214(+)
MEDKSEGDGPSVGARLGDAVSASDPQDWAALIEDVCGVTAPPELVGAVAEAHERLHAISGRDAGLDRHLTRVLAVLSTIEMVQGSAGGAGAGDGASGRGSSGAAGDAADAAGRRRKRGRGDESGEPKDGRDGGSAALRRRVDTGMGAGAGAGGSAAGSGAGGGGDAGAGGLRDRADSTDATTSGSGELRGVSPAAVEERLKLTQDSVNTIRELMDRAKSLISGHKRALAACEKLLASINEAGEAAREAAGAAATDIEKVTAARSIADSKIAELVSGGGGGSDVDGQLQKYVAARSAATGRLGTATAAQARHSAEVEYLAALKVVLDLVVKVTHAEKDHALNVLRQQRGGAVVSVVRHLRRLLGIVMEFVQFELHKCSTARGEIAELHSRLQKHVALYGDGAPSRRRDLQEQVAEFEAVIRTSNVAQHQLVERLSRFASLHIPQLPLDVCSPLSEYLKTVVARTGAHMDVIRPGVQALLDAALERVRASVPKGPPPSTSPVRRTTSAPMIPAIPPPPPPARRLADVAAPTNKSATGSHPVYGDPTAADDGMDGDNADAGAGAGAADAHLPVEPTPPELVIDPRDYVLAVPEAAAQGAAAAGEGEGGGGCIIM